MREDWKVQPETADLSFFKTLVFGPASYSDHALKSYSQLEREKQHLIVPLSKSCQQNSSSYNAVFECLKEESHKTE